MSNFLRKLKLVVLFMAVTLFIGKLLPMMTSFDANPKSVYISHRKVDAKVYSAPMSKSSSGEKDSNSSTIEIALVICGDKERVRKALPIIKSAILFSESMLNIHLFTDFAPREELQNIYSNFSESIKDRVKFVYHDKWFPSDEEGYWESLYGKCATQRLFISSLLKNITSVIYFDSDMIIVSKLDNIWKKFADFNEREVIGGVMDCKIDHCMYMYRKTHSPLPVPWVWKYGVNSGMLLMRLDRMREFDFEKKIIQTATFPKYKESIMGDQDLLNILFHNQSEFVNRLDCSYNYFPNIYCPNISECDVSNGGIKIIHAANKQFDRFPRRFYSLLSQTLINIDINRESSEVISEIINGLDKYEPSDSCAITKPFIFNDFIKANK